MEEEIRPYTMTMSWNNGAEGWYFPVLPEKMTVKRSGAGKDYSIVKTGKIHTIEKPELLTISFDSVFPANKDPYVIEKYRRSPLPLDPQKHVRDIERWMHSGYPIRFVYAGSKTDQASVVSLPMTIESFDRWEEGGSPGDIFFSLTLKEYVFYSAKRIVAVTENGETVLQPEPPARPDERVPNETYTVRPGDYLYKIARMELGDSSRWREIQQLNGISDAELDKLQIGRVLRLPPKTR